MLSNESPYHEQFNSLVNQIRDEVNSLRDEVKSLRQKNNRLKEKLEELQDGQTDIFSSMTESERMAFRHQILGLISKIDNHLEEHG